MSIRKGAPPYRVIFNTDGWSVFIDVDGDLDGWISNIFGPIENTHVDALFWNDGSGGNTARYDSKVLELAGKRFGKADPVILRMIEQGNDPPLVVIREAKRRGLDVFYSLRLNDVHDAHPKYRETEFPAFKEQHPDWMIGAGHQYGRYSALNFAVPEVRALKLEVVKEILDRYDFDGIEIDFMRSPPYFIPGREPFLADRLTELIADIRHHADRVAARRGRPVLVAVSVNETVEANRLDGFDILTWVRDGLIDILMPGKGAMDIDIEAFRLLAAETNVRIYPCLYGYPGDYDPKLPPEMARGLALNYWRQGAHGIYLFNWFIHQPGWEDLLGVLEQIGDPDYLESGKLLFPAENALAPGSACPIDCPHGYVGSRLPAPLAAGAIVSVPLFVGEDIAEKISQKAGGTLELRLTCSGLPERINPELSLNGAALTELDRRGEVISAQIGPRHVRCGKNQVEIRGDAIPFRADSAPLLERLEIFVEYQQQVSASAQTDFPGV